jgi:cell division protease FtsH
MDKVRKQQWWFSIGYLLCAILGLYFLQRALSEPRPRQLSYTDFLAEVSAGHVAEVHISEQELVGILKDSAVKGKNEPHVIEATRLPGIDETSLIKQLETQKVKFSGYIQARAWWVDFLYGWVGPLAFLALLYGLGMWRMGQGSGPLSFGGSRAKIYDESGRFDTKFSDVAGVDEAKAELKEIVDFLKNPQKYQRLGGRIPKGVLLVGPPGTGKTLLARAVSGEAEVPFFSISGSAFVEMFVGVGAARVRDLFDQAKRKAPCVIFIDELDAIGKSRAGGAAFVGHDEREQTLNQLLVEMDGFDSSKGVIIMAATNTPEVLDPALVRPGRFDRKIVIDPPDLKGREEILRVHARKVPLGPDVELATLASRTPGMVGADLANIVNEAALLAARRGATGLTMRDFEDAIDRVMLGFEKKGRLMNPEQKQRVAWHETGHTLVALAVKHADPVHRVSIVPRSIGALGHTLQLPTTEKYLLTKPELEDQIAVMLGGRAAEEIAYEGVVSTGASDDLERASELARQMVTRFGMSERLGHLTYGQPHASRFLRLPFGSNDRNYSERTAEVIDDEVRHLVDAQYERAKQILEERRHQMETVVAELMRKETLDRQEIEALLAVPVHAAHA